MLTPDEIREKLTDVNMSKIARETGLTRPTIYKFLTGAENMQYDTVKGFRNTLKGKSNVSPNDSTCYGTGLSSCPKDCSVLDC